MLSRQEFESLYRSHAAEILGYLRRRGAGDDAEDLLADTFLTAWRRRHDLPDADLRRAWLFGTARRLLLARHRENRAMVPTAQAEMWTDAAASDREDDGRAADVVRTALSALPEVDRELLTMTVWERLPVSEAGKVLGLRPSAARVRLHRVRRRLAADPRVSGLLAADAGELPGATREPAAQRVGH